MSKLPIDISIETKFSLPDLVVFDLDMCLWEPEMYILHDMPSFEKTIKGSLGEFGEGITGVISGRYTIRLFPDALRILQQLYNGKYGDKIKIAAASSADTPLAVSIGRKAMEILEILPGITMRQAFARNWPDGFEDNLQIGRTPPLSSNKAATHFPRLRDLTFIPYHRMIFFDDCNWGDNCGNVEQNCVGVVTQRTPNGITIDEWNSALQKYNRKYNIPS